MHSRSATNQMKKNLKNYHNTLQRSIQHNDQDVVLEISKVKNLSCLHFHGHFSLYSKRFRFCDSFKVFKSFVRERLSLFQFIWVKESEEGSQSEFVNVVLFQSTFWIHQVAVHCTSNYTPTFQVQPTSLTVRDTSTIDQFLLLRSSLTHSCTCSHQTTTSTIVRQSWLIKQ